jgi:hypothetical protein
MFPTKLLVPIVGMASFAILLVITLIAWLLKVLVPHGGLLSHWLVIACFALAWYDLSTAWLAQRVTYPLFAYVDRDSFATYYATYDKRIPFPVILPAVLLMSASVLLVWCHPAAVPNWAVWAGVSLQVVIALSTAFLQVPAHRQLELNAFSSQIHSRLISTSWIRTAAYSAHALLMAWMTFQDMGST